MQIVLHVNNFYDWEKVPDDVVVTDEDIQEKRVKPDQGGDWLMKVEKKADTETEINIPESELHETQIAEFTRGDRQCLTRSQLAHRYVTRYILSHHTHEDCIQEVIVQDDGPDEAGLRALLEKHASSAHGKISPRDIERIVAKYLEPATPEQHAAHFHTMYGVPSERITAERARRQAHQESCAKAHADHVATVRAVNKPKKKEMK